jgi:hypothetical protein
MKVLKTALLATTLLMSTVSAAGLADSEKDELQEVHTQANSVEVKEIHVDFVCDEIKNVARALGPEVFARYEIHTRDELISADGGAYPQIRMERTLDALLRSLLEHVEKAEISVAHLKQEFGLSMVYARAGIYLEEGFATEEIKKVAHALAVGDEFDRKVNGFSGVGAESPKERIVRLLDVLREEMRKYKVRAEAPDTAAKEAQIAALQAQGMAGQAAAQ